MRYVACVWMAIALTGCAGRGLHRVDVPSGTQASTLAETPVPPGESLETFIAKVRRLSAEAKPRPREPLQTVETANQRLGAALAAAALDSSAGTYRGVALEYQRLGIFDQAYEYLQKALALRPNDALTYDAMARLWRDSGFPHLALGDAHRAVFHAPASAAIRNTLGTVLQALGRRALARAEYSFALRLDPAAAYAFNNLCYGWVLDGDGAKAADACGRALAIDPGLSAAHNNLALAHAVLGDMPSAQRAFAANGDRAAELYNSGIVHLARRQYGSAVKAFEAAHAASPSMKIALARARQAELAAGLSAENGRP